jgi:hypothetical protein
MRQSAESTVIEQLGLEQLEELEQLQPVTHETHRAGAGVLFVSHTPIPGEPAPPIEPLPSMPERPTLLDFFKYRFMPVTVNHCLQSAARAMRNGCPEETILACLLHDLAINLVAVDHGWWGAQFVEPYVPEKVSWAIRYHQALRFFADPSVGYEYPEKYAQIFGKEYVPLPHVRQAYEFARNHRWYMEARLVTLNDEYSFDPSIKVSIEPFVDIIGRYFRQPKEGLGNDNSPVSHMWRSLIYPDNPL